MNNSENNRYQDESTRRLTGLLYSIYSLYNKFELNTWEYQEFIKMVRLYCKENNLYYDEEHSRIYKIEDNKSTIVRQ